MEIRRATDSDAMAIAAVHVRSWQAAYPGLIPQDYLDALRPESRLGGWQQVLAATDWPRSGVLLLVDDNLSQGEGPESEKVMGFSHVCPTRDDDLDGATTGEVTSIYLAPDAWGSRNGVALLAASIDQMVAAGYETATLWALDTNARARRFYEIGGWSLDGTTKSHDWGTFVCTDVRYVLDLRDRLNA
jgi:GNAT superfamily N-acetyltransferase